MNTSQRVAGRFLYARTLRAMSLDQALKVMGFPLGASPSPTEVNQAYRKLAPQKHPDRGGSHEEMVELNVAKDILTGKARPSRSTSPPPARRPAPPPRKPDNVVSFKEAMSSAGIPSGVEWVFITTRQRGHRDYHGDESSASDTGRVAYGRVGGKHVFVGIRHEYYEAFYIGGGPKTDVWTIEAIEMPIKRDEGKSAPWLSKGVAKALRAVGWDGRFNSKVISAKDWTFSAQFPTGTASSINNVLISQGDAEWKDPAVTGRKYVIEMLYDVQYLYNDEKPKPGFHPGKPLWHHLTSTSEYYKITLFVNGKPYDLEAEDVKVLTERHILDRVFKNKSSGTRVSLTRGKGQQAVLQYLLNKLTRLPEWVRKALVSASEQMAR